MADVAFEKVTKRFGKVEALHEFTAAVEDGEFVVLLGPSGSGKTTALRILAGLESPSTGHVRIDGRRIDQMMPRERDIAMVFQDYALYPQMSVYDNLAFGLRCQKVRRAEVARRVAGASEMLGLADLLKRKPRELSGGQRQRVALGRALVREPKAFLMDEPLANLDAVIRTQMRGEIKRLQENLGTTTVYVTHDQTEAMTMGHRVVVMHDGAVRQVGTPFEVYNHPADTFIATFLGTPAMSLNNFAAVELDGRLVVKRPGLEFELSVSSDVPRGELVLGVRPEATLPWATEDRLIGPFAGEVTWVEVHGREVFAGVVVADASFTMQLPRDDVPRLGAVLRFGLVPDGIHTFDAVTGQASGRIVVDQETRGVR